MKTTPTPGPWWIDDDGFVAAGSGESYVTIADADCSALDIDEREANRHLISASPDLLAALERLVDDMTEAHADELSDNHGGDGPDCSYCRNIALAQAAIAKAKGSAS